MSLEDAYCNQWCSQLRLVETKKTFFCMTYVEPYRIDHLYPFFEHRKEIYSSNRLYICALSISSYCDTPKLCTITRLEYWREITVLAYFLQFCLDKWMYLIEDLADSSDFHFFLRFVTKIKKKNRNHAFLSTEDDMKGQLYNAQYWYLYIIFQAII